MKKTFKSDRYPSILFHCCNGSPYNSFLFVNNEEPYFNGIINDIEVLCEVEVIDDSDEFYTGQEWYMPFSELTEI
jgi:hypothetical protein